VSPRPTTTRAAAAAAVCLAGATAVYVLAARTATGQVFENAAIDGRPMRGWWKPDPTAQRVVNLLTTTLVVVAIGVIVEIAARSSRRTTLAVGTVMIAPYVITEVLKHDVLGRPHLVDLGPQIYLAANTLPSGHLAAACGTGLAAVLGAPTVRRGLTSVLAAVYVSGAAVAMLWTEHHRPSDLASSCLLAAAVALAVVAARPGVSARARARDRTPATVGADRAAARVLGAVAAAGALVVAVGLPPLLRSAARHDMVGQQFPHARWVGIAGVFAVIALVMLAAARLTPPGWVAGPRTRDRGRTVPAADGAAGPAPYVANRADEGSAQCAGQPSSQVPVGGSGGRSPSGSPPTAGT